MSSVTLHWHDEQQRVIRTDFRAGWVIADYAASIVERNAMIDSANDTVHIILDMSADLSPKPMLFHGFMNAVRNRHPKQGRVIIVTQNTYVRALGPIVQKVDPHYLSALHFVNTLEEATCFTAAQIQQESNALGKVSERAIPH